MQLELPIPVPAATTKRGGVAAPASCSARDEATLAEYRRAMESLTDEWTSIKQLPCRIDYYDTLVEIVGLAEGRRLTIWIGELPAGCRVVYRRKQ